jgi:hypothetical protein
MAMMARHLVDTGQLRADIDHTEVRDLLWTYIAVEQYELLVLQRRWSLDRYTAWLAHALTAALCP